MYSLGSIKTRKMSVIEVKSLKKPGILRGLHEIKFENMNTLLI
mgnify:FL=1